MQSITELGPVKVAEYKKAIRSSSREAKIARTLMLDLLAEAYSCEEFIHARYYDMANEVLGCATNRALADHIYSEILKDAE